MRVILDGKTLCLDAIIQCDAASPRTISPAFTAPRGSHTVPRRIFAAVSLSVLAELAAQRRQRR